LAALLLIAVFAWYLGRQVAQFWGETTLATQTSPDESWSVTIRGKRTIWGSIEVACQTRDSSGQADPWSVVDSVGSWKELLNKYDKIDFEGDVAIAAGEPFVLRPGVSKWPERD
jgi:hypothetical protein